MDKGILKDYWREYEHLTDLYKTYLSVMISLGTFSFAIIGGISTYLIDQNREEFEGIAILFPITFSLGLTVLYLRSIRPAKELDIALKTIGQEYLDVELVPHSFLLVFGTKLLAILYFFMFLGLLYISTGVL